MYFLVSFVKNKVPTVAWVYFWAFYLVPLVYISVFVPAPYCRFVKVKSLSRVRLFATPWTVALQALLSMGFSRQEYWSGLLFPSPGDLPNPGIKPAPPTLEGEVLTTELPEVEVAQLCPTLCDPMNCSLPDSSVHGILRARILEWVAIPFSKGSFQPRG